MNAYELAKGLDQFSDLGGDFFGKCANVLRQQATLIDYYKVRDSSYQKTIAELSKNVDELEEELLKAPQIKELSDEEIEDLIDNWDFGLDISPKHHMFLLCKTILKKASEK
jgi:hypothetical protein